VRKITFADAFRYGYCRTGILGWLRSNGISKKDFLKNGIAEDKAKDMNDCMLNNLFERKYGKQEETKDR